MIEQLKAARKLIAENDLAHGRYAKDSQGRGLSDLNDPSACAFCTVGALARAHGFSYPAGQKKLEDSVRVLLKAAGVTPSIDPMIEMYHYNDTHSKEDVLAMFDKAIAICLRDASPSPQSQA
jgi:hypothetical protein